MTHEDPVPVEEPPVVEAIPFEVAAIEQQPPTQATEEEVLPVQDSQWSWQAWALPGAGVALAASLIATCIWAFTRGRSTAEPSLQDVDDTCSGESLIIMMLSCSPSGNDCTWNMSHARSRILRS